MELTRLTENTEIKSFDCGDTDLNDFIQNDAKAFLLGCPVRCTNFSSLS